jgi:hypothetical protein
MPYLVLAYSDNLMFFKLFIGNHVDLKESQTLNIIMHDQLFLVNNATHPKFPFPTCLPLIPMRRNLIFTLAHLFISDVPDQLENRRHKKVQSIWWFI